MTTWQDNADEFGKYESGWRLALLVACSVIKGDGQGDRTSSKNGQSSHASMQAFAKRSNRSTQTIANYYETWQLVAKLGKVPDATTLKPDDVNTVDISHLTSEHLKDARAELRESKKRANDAEGYRGRYTSPEAADLLSGTGDDRPERSSTIPERRASTFPTGETTTTGTRNLANVPTRAELSEKTDAWKAEREHLQSEPERLFTDEEIELSYSDIMYRMMLALYKGAKDDEAMSAFINSESERARNESR